MPLAVRSLFPALALAGLLLIAGGVLEYLDSPVHWPGYLSMIVFYGAIFYLGSYASKIRKTANSTDIMLAGRSIPLWLAIFTMSSTWVGGGYINGTAEYTSSYGLAWVQAPWGYALSLIVGGLFFARKMRRFEFRTMLDPLEQRYGKRMTAVLFIPALTGELFWTAAILTALGTTFGTVLGMEFVPSIVLSAVIAIAYTALGGLWAVALTDVLQLTFLLLGLALVVPFALSYTGGFEETWTVYEAKKGALATLFPPWDGWRSPDWGDAYWNWWDSALLLIFGGIPWQVYFQRVLSAKTEGTAVRLSIIAGFVCLLAAVPAIIIGMIGDVVDWQAVGAPIPEEPALILPYVIRYLTPPIIATVGLGAIAAAVMSSVDSSILSASSMAAWNIYRPLIRPDLSSEKLGKVIKRSIWIIGISATLISLQVKSVYVLWFLCSDFVYTLIFPALACALFDKKANVYGAAAGFAVAFILRWGGGIPEFGIMPWLPYPMIDEAGIVLFPFRTFAMLSGLITLLGVSRITQRFAPAKSLFTMNS